MDNLGLQGVPHEEQKHHDVVDVHLVQSGQDQEEHQGILDVAQEEEQELIKDAGLIIPDFTDQSPLKLLIFALCSQLLDKFAEGEQSAEHECNFKDRNLELKEPVYVVVDKLLIRLVWVVKLWQQAKNVDHVVPEKDADNEGKVAEDDPLSEAGRILEQGAMQDPHQQKQ